MAFQKVCSVSDVPLNAGKRFKVKERQIALFHLSDGFYATAPRCPHAMGALFKGKIVGQCRVVCPLHRAEFDVKTGAAVTWANFPPGIAQLINLFRKKQNIATYPTKVEGNDVLVDA